MKSVLTSIATYLPDQVETNQDLAIAHPDWQIEKVALKTQILQRHQAGENEFASDLAEGAIKRLFESGECAPESVDFILCCTQTPDHLLPSLACLLQDRCGIPTTVGAVDINQGCSGYVYGLGLADGLICSGRARRVLLVTTDTYSKLLNRADRNTCCLFGDAATASLIVAEDEAGKPVGYRLGESVVGTDGSGACNLHAVGAGVRGYRSPSEHSGLFMNGAEVFAFTLRTIPDTIHRLLEKAGLTIDDIDLVVPHQANAHMLDNLRTGIGLAPERFLVNMHDVGNTVSSSIPLALSQAGYANLKNAPRRLLLVGFGVGYSWSAMLLTHTHS